MGFKRKITLCILALFLLPVAAQATTYSQTDHAATQADFATLRSPLGPGENFTGDLVSITVKITATSTVSNGVTFSINGYRKSDGVNDQFIAPNNGNGSAGVAWFNLVSGTNTLTATYGAFTFDSSHCYVIQIQSPFSGADTRQVEGSSLVVYTPPITSGCFSASTGQPGSIGGATGLDSAYFILVTDGIPTDGVSITNPTATTYTNNPITFDGLYTNTNLFNQIKFSLVNTTVGISIDIPPYVLPASSQVEQPWSVDKYLPFEGDYELEVWLYNTVTGSSTPHTATVFFGLGSTSTVSTTTQANLPGSPTPIDCGTFDIGCYIKNAFVWLFYPTDSSIEQFTSLTLEGKFPFAYAYELGDVYEELFDSGTMASSSISVTIPWVAGATTTITFLSASMITAVPFSSTIRTILGWVLWIMLAFLVYRQTLGAHDANTKV